MKIVSVLWQKDRAFKAIFECEGCGHQERMIGYDDRNYHENVVPKIQCSRCNKSREDLGLVYDEVAIKYKEWELD